MWDCIKESHRLLEDLHEEVNSFGYRDYMKSAKKTFYKINVTKSGDKRVGLFQKQLITFTVCINQVSNAIKKKGRYNITAIATLMALEKLLPFISVAL